VDGVPIAIGDDDIARRRGPRRGIASPLALSLALSWSLALPLVLSLSLTLTLSGCVVVAMPSALCQRRLSRSGHEEGNENGRKLQLEPPSSYKPHRISELPQERRQLRLTRPTACRRRPRCRRQ